jgi:hypothetical protein
MPPGCTMRNPRAACQIGVTYRQQEFAPFLQVLSHQASCHFVWRIRVYVQTMNTSNNPSWPPGRLILSVAECTTSQLRQEQHAQ